jgi:hypothetical protein
MNFIPHYLYYFDIPFDNRMENPDRLKIEGKSKLMLVPLGAKNPKVFQFTGTINNCLYTNSLTDFYRTP